MRLKILVHQDGAEYWSEIPSLPGCFASGRTLSELREAVAEAVGLYLWDSAAGLAPGELPLGASEIDVTPGPSRDQR